MIARALSVALALSLAAGARAQGPDKPDTMVVHSGELTLHALMAHGEGARKRVQLQLLETADLEDALAGLAYLRLLPQVDPRRVAVARPADQELGSRCLFVPGSARQVAEVWQTQRGA